MRWRRFDFGGLATLLMLETRLWARTSQATLPTALSFWPFLCSRVWRQRWLRKAFITRLEDFRKLFRRVESEEKEPVFASRDAKSYKIVTLVEPVVYQVSVDVFALCFDRSLGWFPGRITLRVAWLGTQVIDSWYRQTPVWSEITQNNRHQQGSERKWRTFTIKQVTYAYPVKRCSEPFQMCVEHAKSPQVKIKALNKKQSERSDAILDNLRYISSI